MEEGLEERVIKPGQRHGDLTYVGSITTDQGETVHLAKKQFMVENIDHPDYTPEYADALVVLSKYELEPYDWHD